MSEILLPAQKYEQVAQRAAPGSRLRRVWPLKGGISTEMTFSPPYLANAMCQLAGQLAKIHQIDPAKVDLSFLPKTGNACPELGRERP